MKKKYLFIIIVCIFILSGCSLTKKEQESGVIKVKEISNSIGDYDLSLNREGSFKEINFKYPNDASINSVGTYTIVTLNKKESDDTLFKIAFSYYENKNMVDAMKSDKLEQKDIKTYNGNRWVMYLVEGRYHTYAIEKNNSTYAIDFIYDDDLGSFEEDFMKSVTLG